MTFALRRRPPSDIGSKLPVGQKCFDITCVVSSECNKRALVSEQDSSHPGSEEGGGGVWRRVVMTDADE